MDSNKSADKLREAAECENGAIKGDDKARHDADHSSAEAHPELTRPEHSKGRPLPDTDSKGRPRPSNAGTDGP